MADVTFARNSTTQDMILKQYTSININSGDTVTVDGYCRGLFLYCQGDCTIAGTLTMSATGTGTGTGKGSTHNPSTSTASSDGASVSSTGLRLPMITSGGSETLAAADFAGCGNAVVNAVDNQGGISGDGTIFQIERTGGTGGANGAAGSAGVTGAKTISSGAGGSGYVGPDGGVGNATGAGATGSCLWVVALQGGHKAPQAVKRVLPNGVKVLAVVKRVVDGAAILREVVLMAAEQ